MSATPKSYTVDYTQSLDQMVLLLRELEMRSTLTARQLERIIRQYPQPNQSPFPKSVVIQAYRDLAGSHGLKPFRPELLLMLQMKPTRTMSGVTPVTVLTKPFPCPGKCIFCPNDIRMPKSYLADEPGAQRAERNSFDPYLQTYSRLLAFYQIGHQTAKVEIIILGGTWSYYPEAYQIWFVKECFRALNDFGSGRDDRARIEQRYQQVREELRRVQTERQVKAKLRQKQIFISGNDPAENKLHLAEHELHGEHLDRSYNEVVSDMYVAPEKLSGADQYQMATWEELLAEQRENETAKCRNVGLVIETRPDNISEAEVLRIRRLGCTKTQIGIQSLNDAVLEKNKRGHDVAATRRAFQLLRQAGFKIHAHWMPNLYGSSVELDKQDYDILFQDPDFKPDELKIYPCSLIESAELMQYHRRGEWQPYKEDELMDVLQYCFLHTPPYCRLTRVIRDIPSTDIVTGNKKTNFRQMVDEKLIQTGEASQDIRAREIREQRISEDAIQLHEVTYETSVSKEIFIQFVVVSSPELSPDDSKAIPPKIAAFLRLSLPKHQSFIPELTDAALIREVHVYGQTLGLGEKLTGKAQHLGLGTRLLKRAKQLAYDKGFHRLAVISAVGTREYYRHRGFHDGELYQYTDV